MGVLWPNWAVIKKPFNTVNESFVAMNRLIKAASKLEEVDPEAISKFMVSHDDFLSALANDLKPEFRTATEALETYYLPGGIINWDTPVSS